MPLEASTSHLPDNVTSKEQFWLYARDQTAALLSGSSKQHFITALANTSALLYHLCLDYTGFGTARQVNWLGFYLLPSFFGSAETDKLVLGPFAGRPACQSLKLVANHSGTVGVCAEAFLTGQTVLVEDVHARKGHIACDGNTSAEIVVPLLVNGTTIGVLDLDSIAEGAFDKADKIGLEAIVKVLEERVAW